LPHRGDKFDSSSSSGSESVHDDILYIPVESDEEMTVHSMSSERSYSSASKSSDSRSSSNSRSSSRSASQETHAELKVVILLTRVTWFLH